MTDMRASFFIPILVMAAFLTGCGGGGGRNGAGGGTTYTVTDLGPLSEAPVAINASGQVIENGLNGHAFLYSGGTTTDLGTLGGANTIATAINDGGQIVGQSDTSSGSPHAFLYSGGTITDLGANTIDARGINSTGQIAGTASFGSGATFSTRAFLYSNGSLTDLGALPSFVSSAGLSINDNGQIVGSCGPDSGGNLSEHAFLYSNGQMTEIPGLSSSASTYGAAINASGQVVLYSNSRAALYSNGTTQDLGTLGGNSAVPSDINDGGDIVGNSFTSSGSLHAFLYKNGSMTDLNQHISSHGWQLVRATSINNRGEIVGLGTLNGQNDHGFLLTPQ